MGDASAKVVEINSSEDLQGQLQFETLLADLSARFACVRPDQVDSEIEGAQRRICLCLGIDHSALWQGSPDDPHTMYLTHFYRDPQLLGPPDRMDGQKYFPWTRQRLLRKEIVCLSRVADAPPEAATDKQSWLTFGLKSILGFPLWVGDGPAFGVVSFDATKEQREWPDSLVKRLQLLAQVFANALARKQIAQVLADSEERLRLAAASARAGLWTLDLVSGKIWATEKTKEFFGIGSTEEFNLKRFLGSVHPEDREVVERIIESAIQSGEETSLEYRVLGPEGQVRWFFSRGRRQPGNVGQQDRLMGVTTEITERRRAEEDRIRHSAIVQSSGDAIISLDLQGMITDWNPAAERIFGFAATEAIGKCIQFIIPPELCKEETDMLARVRAGELVEHFETIRVGKDGNQLRVSLTVSPVRDTTGRIVGVAKILRDITEIKVAQEDLQRAYAEVKYLKERLQAESEYLQEEIKDIGRYEQIVGESGALKQVLRQVELVAATDSVVLITGETGTGKELIARAVHSSSRRKGRVMVKVDCAALPSTLIESELFGREKGAYTGALSKQIGRFEIADGSTLFLDEIGDLGVEVQSKLLRLVQDGEFERLGSTRTIKVNVRLIAATHRNLEERVKDRTFREDLLYRLNVFPIRVPPLRERLEDIPLLVTAFVREFAKRMGKVTVKVPSRVMDELSLYSWPGNIRELRNVIERAVIVSSGEKLQLELPRTPKTTSSLSLKGMEAQHILSVLEKTKWRIKGPGGAAAVLGMNPSTLYTTMRRLRIPTRHDKGGIQS